VAHIDIQKKSGSGWVWWIVGLIILALLAWWLIGAMNGDRTSASDGVVATTVVVPLAVSEVPARPANSSAVTTGPITDLATLTTASSASVLAGRTVVLTGAPVASVVSDKGFWAGDSSAAGQRVFVVRGNQDASYTAPDGAVNPGTRVNVYGVVQAMPSDLTQQSTEWNLKSTDRQVLATQPIYIHADSIRMASQ